MWLWNDLLRILEKNINQGECEKRKNVKQTTKKKQERINVKKQIITKNKGLHPLIF